MIIVTGANGFIGSALVWQLNKADVSDLICVDSVDLRARPELLAQRKFKSFLGRDEIWKFLEDHQNAPQVRAILHMGACSSTTELDVEFLRENNFEYTQRLWKLCTRKKIPFMYASSAAVYGAGEYGFDDGLAPDVFTPLNPYGESKAAFDRWAAKQTDSPPSWIGLRFFNVFGPGEGHKGEMASVIAKAHRQINSTGTLRLFRSHDARFKDGMQMRDFVYVKDITKWMMQLVTMMQKNHAFRSGIYNMGSGKARSWLDLASAVFQSMGHQMKIEWIDVPLSMRDRYQYFTEAKMDRLMQLGLNAPEWTLEGGIQDYIENHLRLSLESL